MVLMDYTFSIGWFLGGIGLIVVGGSIVVFYRPLADNLAHGVSSYDRTKLVGIITTVVGILMASNLLPIVLTFLVRLIFQR